MSYAEITGQPCAGKSSVIRNKALDSQTVSLNQGYIRKIFYIFSGINFLGFRRLKVIFLWSMIEDAPIYFRLNIFFNATSKFGIFSYLQSSSNNNGKHILVDEGVSHLPFLFLNSDTIKVINFISVELQKTNVQFLRSPGYDVIENRLLIRGHKRLKFLLLNTFATRMNEIENNLLFQYPSLCKKFIVFEDAASI